jgi:predicted ATP-grasp superfamily ATP-dependent carboligase
VDAALPALEFRPEANPPPRDGHWICKPRRSGAGRGIMLWDEPASQPREPHYFQRRADGRQVSGLFIANTASVHLLGISEQLSGWSAAHAPPFAYCGSIAPVTIAPHIGERIREIGELCGQACQLRGLFGIDFILEGDEPLLLEINPRYPASAELFESLGRQSLVALHAAVCVGATAARSLPLAESPTTLGKLILYAPRPLNAPDLLHHLPADATRFVLPEFADIPRPGAPIGRGDPICTLFASATSIEACREELAQQAARCFEAWLP